MRGNILRERAGSIAGNYLRYIGIGMNCRIPMYFVCFCLLAREYAVRESGYNRGKLIEIHRDLKKNWVSDVCRILIHRDGYELLNPDVFCFCDFWRYIGNGLYCPIPMYLSDRFGPPYIGMGIEISIPMYRLLKLVQ